MAAPPAGIDWMGLSLRSREIVLHIAMRQAAGYSFEEVAVALNRKPPELHHLEYPTGPGKFTKPWVQALLRDVRREIRGRALRPTRGRPRAGSRP